MVRVLAVSDEVDELLAADVSPAHGVELILACGDLPFEYLGHLMDALDVPLAFVPGNHDPDLSGYHTSRAGLTLLAGLPAEPPSPPGAINLDRRVVDCAGLRLAGLGGCLRYTTDPTSTRIASRRGGPGRWPDGPAGSNDRTAGGSTCCSPTPRPAASATATTWHIGDSRRCTAWSTACSPPCCCTATSTRFGAATPDLTMGSATLVRNVVGRHVFEIDQRVYTDSRAR